MSTSTRLLLLLLMGLKELTDAAKVSPLAPVYKPPFIVPKRLVLACICIGGSLLEVSLVTKNVTLIAGKFVTASSQSDSHYNFLAQKAFMSLTDKCLF